MTMKRHCIPGSHPDTFGERLRRGGVPGACGQYVTYDLRGGSVGAPGVADRMGWPVDELGTPVLDWADEDVLTPLRGPALFTKVGTVTAGGLTPWRGLDGSTPTCSRFDAASYLQGNLARAPTDAEDIVGIVLASGRQFVGAGNIVLSTLQNPGTGLEGFEILSSTPTNLIGRWFRAGVAGQTSLTATLDGWILAVVPVDRNGNIGLRCNGASSGAPAATPAGSSSVVAVGIGARPVTGTAPWVGAIRRAMLWYGTSIADVCTTAWFARLEQAVLGMLPIAGTYAATYPYARSSSRSYYPAGPTGRVHVMAGACPPAGGAEGFGADEQIVSVTSKNHAFVTGDGTTYLVDLDAGLTISADSVADATAYTLCPASGGQVLQVQNPTGGALYLRLGNAIGGAPVTSWASVRARVAAGAGVPRFGWMTAAGAYTNIGNVTDNYVRSYGTALPAAATDKQAIEIPAGVSLNLVFWCAGQGARVPDEVPSLAAFGVSSTVVQGVLTTTETPVALLGTVEADFVPRVWGTAVPTAAEDLVRSGALNLIRTDGAGNVTSADGTNTATAAVVEADGVQQTLRHAHGDRGLYVSSASAGNLATYDGALSTALLLRGSCRAVRGFRVLRNPRWRTTP